MDSWVKIRILAILVLISLLLPAQASSQADGEVLLLQTSGPLTPAMVEYLARGIAKAEDQSAEALIFMIDTPGGLRAAPEPSSPWLDT
jgi:membrane-bound ClpP family serine protease